MLSKYKFSMGRLPWPHVYITLRAVYWAVVLGVLPLRFFSTRSRFEFLNASINTIVRAGKEMSFHSVSTERNTVQLWAVHLVPEPRRLHIEWGDLSKKWNAGPQPGLWPKLPGTSVKTWESIFISHRLDFRMWSVKIRCGWVAAHISTCTYSF